MELVGESTMVYRETMVNVLIGRAGDWAARTSWPRAVLLFAFTVALLTAYASSDLFVRLGLRGFAPRFAICFLLGYVAYLAVIAVWLMRKPVLDTRKLLEGASREIKTKSPSDVDRKQSDCRVDLSDCGRAAGEIKDPRALAVLIAILGFVAGLLVLLHWIRYAPWYLGEVLVSGGKVAHRVCPPAGQASVFLAPARQSGWVAFFLLAHYTMIGVTLQLAFPAATTLSDIVRQLQ